MIARETGDMRIEAPAEMQRTLFRALTMCMAAAQHAAGLDKDDDSPPPMRLVTD